MKRKVKSVLSICLFTMLMIPTVVRASEEAVIRNDATGIPDKALYRELAKYLRKSENECITVEEAEELEEFGVSYKRIQDLTGIGYFKNLKNLSVDYAEIKSLKPLKDLKKLNILSVDGNSLKSLEGIEELTGLEHLSVGWNKLTSLNGIENLERLKGLSARYNKISDIRSVAGLTNLEILELEYNEISDASGVENLSKLENLDLSYNRLKKIPNLKGLVNLKEGYGDPVLLDMRGNCLSEKEVKAKLGVFVKSQFDKRWLEDQTWKQRNYTFRLTKPKNIKKITPKTTKISGVVKRRGSKKRPMFVAIYDKHGDMRGLKVKIDKKGRFTFTKKMLKKAKFKDFLKREKTLYFDISIGGKALQSGNLIESIPFPAEMKRKYSD